jgi:hypothetical protein
MGGHEVPLTITFNIASTRTRWTHGPKTLSTRGDGGAKNCCEKVTCVGALLCALLPREFLCARGCVRFSALPQAVLLLCAVSFRCAGLRVIQRRVSCGAAVAREVFCCARGCLFCSALPRAVPPLCARVLFAVEYRVKGRNKARKQHPGAGFLFSCTRAIIFDANIRLALVFVHYGTGIQIYYTSGIPDGGASKLSLLLRRS